jgi:hypothetical protein
MAKSNAERSAKAAAKKKERGEEEIRLHCLPGTRQALADLMTWSGIEEQGEAITLMIHHLHGLGPGGALPLLEPPRHVIEVSQNVSRAFHRKSLLMIQQDPGDEVVGPNQRD